MQHNIIKSGFPTPAPLFCLFWPYKSKKGSFLTSLCDKTSFFGLYDKTSLFCHSMKCQFYAIFHVLWFYRISQNRLFSHLWVPPPTLRNGKIDLPPKTSKTRNLGLRGPPQKSQKTSIFCYGPDPKVLSERPPKRTFRVPPPPKFYNDPQISGPPKTTPRDPPENGVPPPRKSAGWMRLDHGPGPKVFS